MGKQRGCLAAVQDSLKDFLVPFIQKHFEGANYRFMQDNERKHTSRLANVFYEEEDEEGTNWHGADFNPIEECGATCVHTRIQLNWQGL